ncbi:YbdK family carboxylate-amine ligase [Streptomyces bathyalis]|uniref:Putative glutamate--cysteine ligase 2 n=1 Tax=Streptomyces bathyalis TaxID=2710756 RepID=A0A7T1WSB3_9ACTN|nr:glutamate--cysteine ligase [Streptomyces bathyalis]QPP07346.1 YbdK family carboxylate-amine ligase [Streptomyces bathyalis]
MVIDQGGPVLIEGPVEVDLGEGRTAVSDRFVVALCACRRSRNYPWCDTSHRRRPRDRQGAVRGGEADAERAERATDRTLSPSHSAKAAPAPGALTMGVEEEFLLVDEVGGRSVPAGAEVIDEAGKGPALPNGMRIEPELLASQVELASGVCNDLRALAEQLNVGRRLLAEAARRKRRMLISTGTPVRESGPVTLTSGALPEQTGGTYAGLLSDYEACGCHVHVGVADEETAVAVTNHVRGWLPTLLALSANSPFHAGRDTGYASWRMVLQSRFPGSGVPPYFPSAAACRDRLEQLVECGTLADVGQSFWLARPSPLSPAVEFRVADAATPVEEAVLQAALSRALVHTALTALSDGREPATVTDQVAAAVWSAARHGLNGPGIHPQQGRRAPAVALAQELLHHVTPALEEAGDLNFVRHQLDVLVDQGTGAQRQRADASALKGATAVVERLADETARPAGEIRSHSTPTSSGLPATARRNP